MSMPSRSTTVFIQSSSRPTMIVTTGPIEAVSLFSALRRSSPRWIAAPASTAWGTVNDTVTLMLTPR